MSKNFRKIFLFVFICFVSVFVLSLQSEAKLEDDIKGTMKNGTYVNEIIKIKAHFNDDWKILSQEEIAKIMGYVKSSSPTFEELTQGTMPVFYAMTKDGLANVNIILNDVEGARPTDTIIKMGLNSAIKSLKKMYSEMGIKKSNYEVTKIKFLGQDCWGFQGSASNERTVIYQKQVTYFTDDYGCNISVTSVGIDFTDEILEIFSRL